MPVGTQAGCKGAEPQLEEKAWHIIKTGPDHPVPKGVKSTSVLAALAPSEGVLSGRWDGAIERRQQLKRTHAPVTNRMGSKHLHADRVLSGIQNFMSYKVNMR